MDESGAQDRHDTPLAINSRVIRRQSISKDRIPGLTPDSHRFDISKGFNLIKKKAFFEEFIFFRSVHQVSVFNSSFGQL